jgi:hypothetical protein
MTKPYTAPPGEPPLTVNGELHKLADNISFGHGIHAGIHWRSDTDTSIQLGEAVTLSYLQDHARASAVDDRVRTAEPADPMIWSWLWQAGAAGQRESRPPSPRLVGLLLDGQDVDEPDVWCAGQQIGRHVG